MDAVASARAAGSPGERIGVVVVHGVGETEPGWINQFLVPRLEKHEPALEFDTHSEVYDLADSGRSRPGARFDAYLRRGTYQKSTRIALIECFWADLSRIGTGPISAFLAMVRLFYEAPQVLGQASLMRSRRGAVGLVRNLTLFANWLLRWPITGLNSAALFCALTVLGLQMLSKYPELDFLVTEIPMAWVIGTVLALLIPAGAYFAKVQEHRDIALSEVGMSTAILSAILLCMVVAGNLGAGFISHTATSLFDKIVFGNADAYDVRPYLAVASMITFALWFAWMHAVVIAILVLLGVSLWRAVSPSRRQRVSLTRVAAALGLTTIQGMMWKILIALLWFLLIPAVSPSDTLILPAQWQLQCPVQTFTPQCILRGVKGDLLNIVLFNLVMALALAAGTAAVFFCRWLMRKTRRKALTEQRASLPRLIVSPAIIALMFALTLFNFYSFYSGVYQKGLHSIGVDFSLPFKPYDLANWLLGLDRAEQFVTLLGPIVALVIYYRLANYVQRASLGIVHIARDLVDHQYSPTLAAARLFRPLARPTGRRYPRRNRIEQRLDNLMKDVVSKQGFDRLIFVAHSQGTVIVYDYLYSGRDEASIQGVRQIDMVTLASPLSHLYRCYFENYNRASLPDRLNQKLASWTNLWRLDDPIGHSVDLVEGDFIRNEALPAGGHIDYWKERRFCEVLLGLIDPARASKPGATPRAAAAA